MRVGFYDAGEAILRARIDYKADEPNLRDPVLYRIMYSPHPVESVGDKWCIYPMYDYTHPLCDSFEYITHSCCTLEFESHRTLYYWPLIELDMYKPFVWEFSRLNLEGVVTSKRKILTLIQQKIVNGWDDPRLFTLAGLRRRGIPIAALNEFLDRVPVSRRGNDSCIRMHLFNRCVKQYIDSHWHRCLAVVDPVKLVITNLPADHNKVIDIPFFPKDVEKGSYKVTESREVWVERGDVMVNPDASFYRISVGKVVRLKYSDPILITKVDVAADGTISVEATTELPEGTNDKKIKATLNWVS